MYLDRFLYTDKNTRESEAIKEIYEGGEDMGYHECENCGANLDPYERCDCEKEKSHCDNSD